MDGVERDESFRFADVTEETLEDMRQESAHSLERDIADSFFWNHARPDAVAGMAKVYLCARCPTPYWRALVSSNSYALWGGVVMARIEARRENAPCGPRHLGSSSLSGASTQARLLNARARRSMDVSFQADMERAEGLALPYTPLGDLHKHSALRALFAAVLLDKPINWPDLPARLLDVDDIPRSLPGLSIDLRSLAAKPVFVDRHEAEAFWLESFHDGSSRILLVPDWASWMLADASPAPFAKTPTLD